MLVHHTDSKLQGILGTVDPHLLAINADGSARGLLFSEENLHQGGFPRTVLTRKGVDLTSVHIEDDVAIGNYPIGIDFRDILHAQC
jgi:hypothetical protein